jgi:hypothetical protein
MRWGMSVQRDRDELIYRRAYELAASGFHINSITVVTALMQEGFSEAADLLNTELIRADIREVCSRHWRGVASIPEPAVVLTEPDDSQAQGELQKFTETLGTSSISK